VILLKNETYLLVALVGAFLRFQGMNGNTIQKIFSSPGMIVHSENVQKRRFAGAGRSHDGNEIALLNLEIDVAKHVKEFALRERINALDVL
jgi:hypothetical protein